jgi:cobyric acid synthase CobQ
MTVPDGEDADRILVCGTGSNVGKSLIVTGLCRSLVRRGRRPAPFKAQNMSLNSFVTPGGGEIGRAQAAQALASRTEPHVDMNPVLLKPGARGKTQVVVLGHPANEKDAKEYQRDKSDLLGVVMDSFGRLANKHDIIVGEGAGSPAEINLRRGDIVNLGLARAVGAPIIVVGDIDRGGVFAAFIGTQTALDPSDASHLRAYVINRFRGDPSLLRKGVEQLLARTGLPTLGVVPEQSGLHFDAEDSLAEHPFHEPPAPVGEAMLRVGVVALPRTSNLTDLDPLGCEPGVSVRLVRIGEEAEDVDLLVIPGTRATVDDLEWMRERRFGPVLEARVRAGRMTLGICGGYQMLGREIHDDVESGRGKVAGFGLLPVTTTFSDEKTLCHHEAGDSGYSGFEIRHGQPRRVGGAPLLGDEGCRSGGVIGTSWHGILENDQLRRDWLSEAAQRASRRFIVSPDLEFARVREDHYERTADLVDEYIDVEAIQAIAAERRF